MRSGRFIGLWLLLSACNSGVTNESDFEREFGVSITSVPDVGHDGLAPGGGAQLLDALVATLGGREPEFGETHVYATGMNIVIRDPSKPKNLDEYYLRPGTVEAPRPVTGAEDKETAPLSQLRDALARVPDLAAKAVEGTDFTLNHVTGVTITPHANAPVEIEVSLSDKRNSQTVRFAADGTRLR